MVSWNSRDSAKKRCLSPRERARASSRASRRGAPSVVVGDAPASHVDGEALEAGEHRIDVLDEGGIEIGHARAAPRQHLHQALAREQPQRLAQRRARDAELPAQVALGEPAPRLERAVDDQLAQHARGLLDQERRGNRRQRRNFSGARHRCARAVRPVSICIGIWYTIGQSPVTSRKSDAIDMSRLLLALARLCACASRHAAEAIPTKSVRVVVPFAPGGGTDVVARVLGQKLSVILGQQFVIENKARRRRLDRHRPGREGAGRRLHAPPRAHQPRDQPEHLREAAVRYRARFRADLDGRHHADPGGGAAQRAREQPQGAGGARARATRRRSPTTARRATAPCSTSPPSSSSGRTASTRAHPLQGRRPGGDGAHLRRGAARLRDHAVAAAATCGRDARRRSPSRAASAAR